MARPGATSSTARSLNPRPRPRPRARRALRAARARRRYSPRDRDREGSSARTAPSRTGCSRRSRTGCPAPPCDCREDGNPKSSAGAQVLGDRIVEAARRTRASRGPAHRWLRQLRVAEREMAVALLRSRSRRRRTRAPTRGRENPRRARPSCASCPPSYPLAIRPHETSATASHLLNRISRQSPSSTT